MTQFDLIYDPDTCSPLPVATALCLCVVEKVEISESSIHPRTFRSTCFSVPRSGSVQCIPPYGTPIFLPAAHPHFPSHHHDDHQQLNWDKDEHILA